MRIAICFRHKGDLCRLVWLNEDAGGFYYGFPGGELDAHGSYHADGHRHTKLGDEYVNPFDSIPIDEWRGVQQVTHISMAMRANWFSARTAYAGDGKTETVVVVAENHFAGDRSCALDIWLFDRGSESQFYERLKRHGEGMPDFSLIVDAVFALDNFPSHKIAITVRASPPRG